MPCTNEEKETIMEILLENIGTELEPEGWCGHGGRKTFQTGVRCSCFTVWEKRN